MAVVLGGVVIVDVGVKMGVGVGVDVEVDAERVVDLEQDVITNDITVRQASIVQIASLFT